MCSGGSSGTTSTSSNGDWASPPALPPSPPPAPPPPVLPEELDAFVVWADLAQTTLDSHAQLERHQDLLRLPHGNGPPSDAAVS